MKRQIRKGVFETNSSSTHSLTMCSNKEYEKWKSGKTLYWGNNNKFGIREDIIEELKNARYNWNNELIYSCVNWDDFETFEQHYVTPNGDEVVAFGYYGYDY